jgi:hypothetical protein
MSRTLRTLFTALVLALVGWPIDSDGSGGPATTNGDGGDTGWHIDPNG